MNGITWEAQYFPEGHRYEHLKQSVLKRCQKDRLHKAFQFLDYKARSDQGPYQIYNEIVAPVRDRPLDVIHAAFLRQLPREVARQVRPDWLNDRDALLREVDTLYQRHIEYKSHTHSVSEVSAFHTPPQYAPHVQPQQFAAPVYAQTQAPPYHYTQPVAQQATPAYNGGYATFQPNYQPDPQVEQLCEATVRQAFFRGGKRGGKQGRGAARKSPPRLISDQQRQYCYVHFTHGSGAKTCQGTADRPCQFPAPGNGQPCCITDFGSIRSQ